MAAHSARVPCLDLRRAVWPLRGHTSTVALAPTQGQQRLDREQEEQAEASKRAKCTYTFGAKVLVPVQG